MGSVLDINRKQLRFDNHSRSAILQLPSLASI